jgi:hypothetical protein
LVNNNLLLFFHIYFPLIFKREISHVARGQMQGILATVHREKLKKQSTVQGMAKAFYLRCYRWFLSKTAVFTTARSSKYAA